jgi:excisionase family DNA binding protein
MDFGERVSEIARRCKVDQSTVLKWIVQGVSGTRLAAVKVGGRWRVTDAALEAFHQATTAAALPPAEECRPVGIAGGKAAQAAQDRVRRMCGG